MIRNPRRQDGSVLLAIILMLPFLILIAALYTELTVSSLQLARQDQMQTHAQIAADAGIDQAMQEINQDENWSGTGSEVEVQSLTNNVRTTYEVTVVDNGESEKIVTSTGRSYQGSNSTPVSDVSLEVRLRSVTSGEYSVVSGVGGLEMNNSAKILGGDVFINGKISLTNSAQIGLSTSPVNLEVAHQSCPSPPDASYPDLCSPGENGEPITLSNSAHIYGNVQANNQLDGSDMSNPGLTASTGVTPQPLPPHDRAAQVAEINAADAANSPDAISGSSAGCSSGNKTWPANLKINGNVRIRNSCVVTVEGNIWITGNLEVTNSARMIVSNSLGSTRPVIMVDGDEASFSNSSVLQSNSSDTGFMIITYKSDAPCSPDCTDVTGTSLYNSQNDTTISLSNSASGPNTIFYARWTKVDVGNSGQLGALIGQTVKLSNSGTITFGTSTGTGTKFWVIDNIRRLD